MSARSAADTIESPLQFLRISIEDEVIIELKDNRTIRGILHSFDEHMNLLIGDSEETITRTEVNADGTKTKITEEPKHRQLLFVRGDTVIALANAFQ